MSWQRLTPLSGIVAVVLWVIGTIIAESGNGDEGAEEESPQAILADFQDNADAILTGGIILLFGVLFFIWFLGSLRTALREAEGGTGWLTAVAFGSGLLAALGMILQVAPRAQGAIDEEHLAPEAAQTLDLLSQSFFGVTEFALIPMFVAVGLLALRTRVLPVWLGWASFALALVLAIIWVGWIGVVFGLPLWTLVVSVLLYLRGRPAEPTTPVP